MVTSTDTTSLDLFVDPMTVLVVVAGRSNDASLDVHVKRRLALIPFPVIYISYTGRAFLGRRGKCCLRVVRQLMLRVQVSVSNVGLR